MELDDDALKVANGLAPAFSLQPWPLIGLCSAAIYWKEQNNMKDINAVERFITNPEYRYKWRLD